MDFSIDEAEESVTFVRHIKNHLDNNDTGLKLSKLPEGKVGCCICGKTVEEIFKEEHD